MTFAQEQNIPSDRNFTEERGTAALEFFSRQDEFHPTVMRRKGIKAHGLANVATVNAIATRRDGNDCAALAISADSPALRIRLVFINVCPDSDQSIVALRP